MVIDLKKQPEEILAGMRKGTRRNVRHALEKGITVVEGEARDLGTFRALMLSLCERRKTSPNPPQADFFQHLWKKFNPKGWIKLFIAMYGQEPVSAAIAFSFKDWFRLWKVGWSGQHGNLKPNEAMEWEMIQYARRTSHHHFDFVGVDPSQIKAMHERKRTEPLSENENSYKLGFGGEIKFLPGAYYYFFNPIIRTAMRCGFGKFLNSDLAQQLTLMYTKHSIFSNKGGDL